MSMHRGISLMEVLISIFVLAIGLLGVAAMIPAGKSEIAAADRLDNGAMIGRGAFRDAQTRGYLNPASWVNSAGQKVFRNDLSLARPFTMDNGGTQLAQLALVLDPLGLAAGYGNSFPTTSALHPMGRICTTGTVNAAAADLVFRASIDLVQTANTNKDLPPIQFYSKDASGNPVRRASDGNFSWLATITVDPTTATESIGANLGEQVTFSVAVFNKRILANTGTDEIACAASPVSLNEWQLTIPASHKGVKPGQWIMVSGKQTVGGVDLFFYRWYRVLSANKIPAGGGAQRVSLAGRDWNTAVNADLQAYLFDGVVAVYEKTVSLELD